MWQKCIFNQKALCFVGGILTATLGVKAVKCDKARELCVKGMAKGMKFQKDAQEMFQNMKEDAVDMCHDAKQETTAD